MLNDQEIEERLKAAKMASVRGKTLDGSMVRIKYEAFRKPTEKAIREAAKVATSKASLQDYLGYLDRYWRTQDNSICICIRVLNRESEDKPEQLGAYRTFNVDKGKVIDFLVLT